MGPKFCVKTPGKEHARPKQEEGETVRFGQKAVKLKRKIENKSEVGYLESSTKLMRFKLN